MKNLSFLFVVCVLAVTATGQVAGRVNAEPHAFVIPSHPQRATQMAMATPQSLVQHSSSMSAKGERPLWELMPEAPIVPLGDTARTLRKEHLAAKKAVVVWTN